MKPKKRPVQKVAHAQLSKTAQKRYEELCKSIPELGKKCVRHANALMADMWEMAEQVHELKTVCHSLGKFYEADAIRLCKGETAFHYLRDLYTAFGGSRQKALECAKAPYTVLRNFRDERAAKNKKKKARTKAKGKAAAIAEPVARKPIKGEMYLRRATGDFVRAVECDEDGKVVQAQPLDFDNNPCGDSFAVQFSELDGPLIEDEVADDEEAQIARYDATLAAALATIKGLLFDDPFETLGEVIAALGLKMADVAAWAQEQAELWGDGDEPIVVKATFPAEHGESEQPTTGSDDLAAASQASTTEENSRDEAEAATTDQTASDPVASGQAKDTLSTATKPTAEENVAPAPTEDKTAIVEDGGHGKRGKGEDLVSLVVAALTIDGGLELADVVEKVLKSGYKTQSKNLAMAINNILGWLRKFGKVTKDESTKKYSLVEGADLSHLHEEIVAYNAAAAEAKAAAAKVAEEERKQREKLLNDFAEEEKRIKAEKRLKSLQVVTESLPKATDLLTTAYASIAAPSVADRADLHDVADEMYQAAECLAILLDLEYEKESTPEAAAQSCSPAECHDRLVNVKNLIVQAENRLRSIKLTDTEFSSFQAEGQKMFDTALAIQRAVGID